MRTEKDPEKQKENGNGLSESNAFSVAHMDQTADPFTDFFTYSAGNWIKNHPVPPDKAIWGAFEGLREKNAHDLKAILEKCSGGTSSSDSLEHRLGDFYKSAMNTDTLESLQFKPLAPRLEKIGGIQSSDSLTGGVAGLHSSGVMAFFRVFSRPDSKNSSIYALYLYQGGLALPNKDYYVSDSFAEMREQYVAHIQKLLEMYGVNTEESRKNAETVLTVETELAKSSRNQADLRDAEKNYNKVPVADLVKRFPELHFDRYLRDLEVPPVDYVVIGQPEFFDSLNSLMSERPLEDLKLYLKWMAIHSAAPLLFSKAEEENFDMFSRKLRGQQEPEPRWIVSVRTVDQSMGEALGELYVKEHFGREAGEKMAVLIDEIKDVFRDRLAKLPWMTEETRKHALAKFSKFHPKIGHPEKFRDYSSIEIRSDDYLGNVFRCATFEMNRQIKRVGTPVDRNEWRMSPPTVNAYFFPPGNEIVFPAGILQPPFFDVSADDAVNYGAIGAVISHEVTHGYDDQGSRYDEEGNLRDWWSPEDKENFLKRANKVVELYSSLEPVPGLHVNGKLTLGENIADFGGVSIAFEALQRHLEKHPELRKNVDGLTPEQRFFISWSQLWRENIKEPELRRRVSLDPHSPNKFRGSIPVYNHPEFENAFNGTGKHENPVSKKGKIDIW